MAQLEQDPAKRFVYVITKTKLGKETILGADATYEEAKERFDWLRKHGKDREWKGFGVYRATLPLDPLYWSGELMRT